MSARHGLIRGTQEAARFDAMPANRTRHQEGIKPALVGPAGEGGDGREERAFG
jgi:hypothetical protein